MALTTRVFHAADSSLRKLDPVLDAWHGVLDRYGELWHWTDVPYWYNERASLSTLAAAVWISGGVALEEYRTDKDEDNSGNGLTGTSNKGRGDLYFHYSDAHFIAEAKQHWAYPGRSLKGTIQETRVQLDRACGDARVKRAYDDPSGMIQKRLGLLFAVPCFPATAQRTWEKQTETWLQSILTDVPMTCVTWYGAPTGVLPADKKGWLYPGACLLLRELP